jgi:hypothetical protein
MKPEPSIWAPSSEPPLAVDVSFVLGTGRCGSTLVHEVVARHSDLAFVSNLDDIQHIPWPSRVNGPLYRRLTPRWTQKGGLRFAPSEAYRLLDRRVSPMISDPYRDLTAADVTPWLARQLTQLFNEVAAAQDRRRVLHKLTGWPRARFLNEVFPGARFVHVVRDGRAVANSWLQMDWWRGHRGPEGWHWGPLPERYATIWEDSEHSFVALAGIAWLMLLDAFEATAANLPAGQWLQLRYEDLLHSPHDELRRVTDFLDLDWTPAFEAAVSSYRFEGSRQDAFRRDLTPAQVDLLDRMLGERLASLGYGVP